MSQSVRYLDGAHVMRQVRQHDPDAWIVATYRRWFALGIAVTVLLVWVAR